MHTKNIVVRAFKSSDTHEIITLFREAVHAINIQHYSPEQVAVWAPEEIDSEKWRQSLEQHITYVAQIDDKIVGFIDMSHEGYLDRLYIHKEYLGGKIAYMLFKKIEQAARDLGLTKITTDCSITAKRPAERMGFVEIKEQTVMCKGVALINYVMEKKL